MTTKPHTHPQGSGKNMCLFSASVSPLSPCPRGLSAQWPLVSPCLSALRSHLLPSVSPSNPPDCSFLLPHALPASPGFCTEGHNPLVTLGNAAAVAGRTPHAGSFWRQEQPGAQHRGDTWETVSLHNSSGGGGLPSTLFHCTPGWHTSQKAAGQRGWRWGVRGLGGQALGWTLAMCEL